MARYTSNLLPSSPEEPWYCDPCRALLNIPRDAGADPSLGSSNQAHNSVSSISNATVGSRESVEYGELTFVLSPMVPETHEHIHPVHYRSTCRISQRELEIKVLTVGYNKDSDEQISIQIVDSETQAYRCSTVKRSVLSKSGVLNKFFGSDHFQPHAETALVFSRYPVIIIDTQFRYLSRGKKAIYALRVQLMQFSISVRLRRLIHIVVIAEHMEIPCLVLDAFLLLSEITKLVTPTHCIMLVEMFYGKDAVRHALLHAWANKCLADNMAALSEMPRFVLLSQTTWLKFEVDRFLAYEVCPYEDKEPEPEEEVEELEAWERGAPPGSQLGPSPPKKKAKKWWRKEGRWVKVEEVAGGVPAAEGEGEGGKKGKGKVAGFLGRH